MESVENPSRYRFGVFIPYACGERGGGGGGELSLVNGRGGVRGEERG